MKSHVVWGNRRLVALALATVAAGFSVYVPVSALFLTERGQSLSDIFIFESILVASILLAEIPVGLISDRINRRWVILAGFALNAIAEVLFAVGHSFEMFALSFLISGFGIAMLTGVQDAYIYDALGRDADSTSIGVWGHLSSLELAAGVVGSVAGGLLASIDISTPAAVSAGLAIVAAMLAGFIPNQRPEQQPSESPLAGLGAGISLLFRTPLLLYVAVASSATFVLFNSAYVLNQPMFAATGIPVAAWGFIAGGAQLAAAGYNFVAARTTARLGRRTALFLAMSYGAAGFWLMAVPHPVVVITGFVLIIVGMHARGPITMSVANRLIPQNRRATVLNIASSVGSLVGIAVNPLIGFGADANRTLTVLAIGAVLAIVAITWIPLSARYLNDEAGEEAEPAAV